ncbi:response regulator [Haloferula helveola]|uniref:Response regulator n=1 Tax=Haloferula helveola TaxID=490095 RepID=A0ABN6H0N3_9BACT|nr:response regulator [Haloferula helveola]
MTYLLVDDYAAARRLVRDLLEGPDVVIHEAENGIEAVASFASHRPDWVVMDIDMPEMDGLAATREIRRREPCASVAIVTQHDSDDMRMAAADAGAKHFLTKDRLLDLPDLLHSDLTHP